MDKRLFDQMINEQVKRMGGQQAGPMPPPHVMHGASWRTAPHNVIDMKITHVTYKGPRIELQGKTALWRKEFSKFLVQFDDRELPDNLAFGWHEFDPHDFIHHAEMADAAVG